MHPLDHPAWNALSTRQAHLAIGGSKALRFDQAHAIFADTAGDDDAAIGALGRLVTATGRAIVMRATAVPPVPGTTVERMRAAVQMVAEAITPARDAVDFEPLGDGDAAEMLALATLTEPGPFFARTHRLGNFIGVRRGGRLVAMAGERLKLTGHSEVSGVCTLPDYRGQGLAGALMRVVARRILAAGDIPFLQAYAENAGAIALYESLGFRVRSAMTVTVLAPA